MDRSPAISTDGDAVHIQIALDGAPDEEWSRVYAEFAQSENLPARIIGSGKRGVLELELSSHLGADDVAPILSKAVELLVLADRERENAISQMRHIEAAAKAWYKDFKRNDPRAR